MNKRILPFFILVLAALTFQSCKDDDSKPSNQLTVAGKSYTLADGYSSVYEQGEGIYSWQVNIFSDIAGNTEKYHYVYLNLYSNNAEALPAGTYTFNEEHNNLSFYFAEIGVDIDMESQDGDYYEDYKAGTITVAKSGDVYTITFDLTTTDDVKVKGTFRGELPIED